MAPHASATGSATDSATGSAMDLRKERPGKAGTSMRKILALAAAVFVVFFASVSALLLYLGQGALASFLPGFFVGVTAAIEIGWFGGAAFFREPGER